MDMGRLTQYVSGGKIIDNNKLMICSHNDGSPIPLNFSFHISSFLIIQFN